jgi:hypothetical protein
MEQGTNYSGYGMKNISSMRNGDVGGNEQIIAVMEQKISSI